MRNSCDSNHVGDLCYPPKIFMDMVYSTNYSLLKEAYALNIRKQIAIFESKEQKCEKAKFVVEMRGPS